MSYKFFCRDSNIFLFDTTADMAISGISVAKKFREVRVSRRTQKQTHQASSDFCVPQRFIAGSTNQYILLAETFYRIGSVIFGGGQVVLPMLVSQVRENHRHATYACSPLSQPSHD